MYCRFLLGNHPRKGAAVQRKSEQDRDLRGTPVQRPYDEIVDAAVGNTKVRVGLLPVVVLGTLGGVIGLAYVDAPLTAYVIEVLAGLVFAAFLRRRNGQEKSRQCEEKPP